MWDTKTHTIDSVLSTARLMLCANINMLLIKFLVQQKTKGLQVDAALSSHHGCLDKLGLRVCRTDPRLLRKQ